MTKIIHPILKQDYILESKNLRHFYHSRKPTINVIHQLFGRPIFDQISIIQHQNSVEVE